MIPLFPLNLVVFPQEQLNLHVFEPRYRQLVADCVEEKITFGVPPFLNKKLQAYGAELEIIEIFKRYTDGRLDIKTKCTHIFKLTSYINPAPQKLYAGGQIKRIEQIDDVSILDKEKLISKIKELWELVRLQAELNIEDDFISFKVAHKIGLSLEQEYEMMTLQKESERYQFMLRHLELVIPVIQNIEKTRERIRMNGHFKSFDELNF